MHIPSPQRQGETPLDPAAPLLDACAMGVSPSVPERHRFDRDIVRGAVVNLLGLAAKVIHPLFLLFVTWMFGPAIVGLYLLAMSIHDVASNAVTSGLVDATTLFASRRVDDAQQDRDAHERLYRVIANGMVFSLGVGLVLMAAFWVFADLFVARFYPQHPELAAALRVLAGTLPALSLSRVAIAGTKAYLRMEYDAGIMGFLHPFSLLVLSAVAWAMHAGLMGLMLAQLATQWVVAAAALWALSRHASVRRIVHAARRLRLERHMLAFAIPQSMNMTFSRYATRLDLIMLGAFGHSAVELGFYGTAALITSNLRQIKLVYGAALGPVIARFHAAQQNEALQGVFNQVSRWTTSFIVPVVFMVVVLRDDLLRVVNEAYTGDTRFVAVLLLPPLLSCAFGLAGNCVTYTGHSRWTLFNSLVIAGFNTALNALLIPRYGMIGAAMATVLASALHSVLQLWELAMLERVRLTGRAVLPPYAGLLIGVLLLALVWDPAAQSSLSARVATALGFALVTLGSMAAAGHPEIRAWLGSSLGVLASRK